MILIIDKLIIKVQLIRRNLLINFLIMTIITCVFNVVVSRNLLLLFLHILYLSITSVVADVSEFKCKINALVTDTPLVNFPPELIQHEGRNLEEHVTYHVVAQGVTNSFVVNCTSNFPVDWIFDGSVGNTVVNSARSYTFDHFENGNFVRPCYYSALIFTSVENEITGKYSCIVNHSADSSHFDPRTNGGRVVTIFAGLSALTVPNRRLKYSFTPAVYLNKMAHKTPELYSLPCAANHPSVDVSLFYKDFQTSNWILETNIAEYLHGSFITVNLPFKNLPRQYKCVGILNNTYSEVLYLDIPSYPDAIFTPADPNVVYKLPYDRNKSYFFLCISKFPVDIKRNDSNQLATVDMKRLASSPYSWIVFGFQHELAAIQRNPDNNESNNISYPRQIICSHKETNKPYIVWKYILLEKEDITKLQYPPYRTYFIHTTAPESTTMKYITANTKTELSMRLKCLHTFEGWDLCSHRLQSIPVKPLGLSHVYFQTPENVSGVFLWSYPDELNAYTSGIATLQVFIPLSNGQGNGNQYTRPEQYLDILVVNPKLDMGKTLFVQCVSSEGFYFWTGFWVFIWKNGSHISVPKSSIIENTVLKTGALFTIRGEILIDSMDIDQIACYGILAMSEFGKLRYKSMSLYIQKNQELNTTAIVIIVVFLTITLIGFVPLIMRYWKWRTTADVDSLYNGSVKSFFEGYELTVREENNALMDAESRAYNQQFEIPRDKLKIDSASVLGSGEYGLILKGELLYEEDEIVNVKTIAVKTIRGNRKSHSVTVLMSELKVMIYIGNHANVVTLIGACTANLVKRELYIVMEYCQHGSLKKYLINARSTFNSTLHTDVCLPNQKFANLYKNLQLPREGLTTVDLVRWSRQIISGMAYLASKKVIHGDLACRNILLDDCLSAKISDFGLSRRMYERSEYVKQSKDPLPWRWMAIESLRYMTFSTESDVWSFGVVLWELFSLAQTPYPGCDYTETFMENLENNFRLSKPEHSPSQLYDDVMLICWIADPQQRPSFEQLGEMFDMFIRDSHLSFNNIHHYLHI